MKLKNAFLTILFAILIAGCSQSSWIQEDFDSIKQNIETISVIFPQVNYYCKGDDNINKAGYSLEVSKKVSEVLENIIGSGKYVGKSAKVFYDSSFVNNWLRDYKSGKLKSYKRLSSYFENSSNKKIFSPESELKNSLSKIDSKYYIIVTGMAFQTDFVNKNQDVQQRESFKLFFDSPMDYEFQWDGMQLEIALVAAGTNEILFYNFNDYKDSRYNPRNKEDINTLCTKLLSAE
jgi:hypothetical protein